VYLTTNGSISPTLKRKDKMTDTIPKKNHYDYEDSLLLDAWRSVNLEGKGFPTDAEKMDEAKADYIDVRQIDLEGAFVGYDSEGNIIVVADAHGAWACDVTEII